MLPNMASSKSFRATLLPSSFSFPTLRTNSDPDHRSRKLPRRTSSLDPLKQLHLRNASTPSPVQTPQTLQEEPVFIHPKGSDGLPGEPVPPGTRLRTKSKTWGARVSSLLPPLISPNADPNPQPVTRKTVMAAPTSPPAQPSPPPPYDPRESPTNRLNKSPPRSVLPVEPRGHPSPPRAPQGLPPTQTTMSLPELDMGMLSLSTSVKPQIMAPIPPSPIAQDVHPEQAPAGLTDLQRGAPAEAAPATKQARLQKENPESRRRSASLQQPSLPPRMGVRALRGEGSEEVGFPVGAGLAPIRLMCKGQASRMHGSCPMRLLRPSTTRPSSRTGKRYASLVTAARIIFLICFSPPRFLSYGTRAAPC